MNILIELPTWLGDTVMATPAIENIIKKYPDAKLTLFGSFVSIQTLKNHPNVIRTIVDDSKKSTFRYIKLYKIAKSLNSFDIAFSFRRTPASRFFLFFIRSKRRFYYKRYTKNEIHQVIRYNDFVNRSLDLDFYPSKLKLYYKANRFEKPTLGINPGASYGSAKRWYPNRFAQVAKELSSRFDIIIFGGSNELDIAKDIEDDLIKSGVKNYKNLAGKTSVSELIENIGGLSYFITGDSGPMHIAAAYDIPTVALFGPTKYKETSQWMNQKSKIVTHNLKCAPCMKRECPLLENNHACMKEITANEVIDAISAL